MAGDNGKGLRALFYGLCCLHGVGAWDEEQAGPMPADFYLTGRIGLYVVIVPCAAARQVEIGALAQRQERFIVLNRDDLDQLRSMGSGPAFTALLRYFAEFGTQADSDRGRLGLPAGSREGP